MVKLYGQEIPGAYFHGFRKANAKLKYTQYRYYIGDYNYGYVGVATSRPPAHHPSLQGWFKPRHSVKTQKFRRRFFWFVKFK